MSGSVPFFDIIILFGGIYLLVSTISMLIKGTIPGILISKGVKLPPDADSASFVKVMKLPSLIMSLAALLTGGLGIATKYVTGIDMIQFVVLVIAFIMLLAYGFIDVWAQKKYLKLER